MTWVLFLAWCSSVPEPAQPQPQVIPTPVEEAPVEPVEEPMSSIVDIVVETDAVSILEDIVIELELVDALSAEGPFTVFAPTNDAFEQLLIDIDMTLEELYDQPELLTSIVLYHVLDSEVPADDVVSLPDWAGVETLNGESIAIYNQQGVQINESNVIQTDIEASNWIIHLIDSVLLPPSAVVALSTPTDNIVETAVETWNFPTLVAAVQAAGLVETLSAEGPFTVFAPTEEAFAVLLTDLDITAQELLADTDLLTTVLTYHVVPGNYAASDVVGLDAATEFDTAQWTTVSIDPNDWAPTINESNIIATDVFASNGVIHVIDKVLIPSM